MSSLQEKLELYHKEVKKLKLKIDADLLTVITKGLGPSIYQADSEKVASSDQKELDSVKQAFIKKFDLEDSEKLDQAIANTIEKIGTSNRNKYRAIFYAILVGELGLENKYEEEIKLLKESEGDKKTPKAKIAAPKKEEKAKSKKIEIDEDEIKDVVTKPVAESEEEEEEEAVTPVSLIEEDEPRPQNTQEFLDNFDWHKYEEGIEELDQDKLAAFDEALKGTIGFVEEGEVIDGEVVRITEREAIIDINSKSEGVISLNEFRYNPDLAVGDTVEVLVDKREDSSGQLVLSHKKARIIKAWDRVNAAYDNQEIVTGYIKCRTKGGMIVDVFGIEAFLPGSQIDVKPIRDYDQYVDKTMEFKVVKINHEFKNVVVSHKALIDADLAEQKKEIIGQLEKGQVLEGVVKNITSYGVFVDLGGVDGLIHITDLSWSRINHPSEVVELDEKLNVVILDFDDNKSRIQLGLKQLQKHPWDALDENLKVGDKVTGKVAIIADYGAFVEVSQGVEGLIHVSEMSWSTHLRSAQDFVNVGDEVEAVILTLDRDERKMSLGMKQLHPDPWTDITSKYPVGSTHTGIVRNYTNFGVFVELEEGIDGLVYISDLSWTTKVKHPSDFVKVGDQLQVKVLELDVEGRKLNLGHKQTTENPWDVYEKNFTMGSTHKGKVVKITDKGALVSFDDSDDLEAFVPNRHMEKEDGSTIGKGDETDFVVLEFNKEYRRLVISHSATYKEQEKKNLKAAQKKIEDTVEKSTLGDISALADLKNKMDSEKK